MPEIVSQPKVGRLKRFGALVVGFLALCCLVALVEDVDAAGTIITLAFAGGAWMLWRSADKDVARVQRAELGRMQLEVLKLAREDGRLTVTEVASRLHWPMDRAAAVLDSLDDGLRVASEPSAEGVIVYEFRELIHDPDRPQLAATPPPLPRAMPGQ